MISPPGYKIALAWKDMEIAGLKERMVFYETVVIPNLKRESKLHYQASCTFNVISDYYKGFIVGSIAVLVGSLLGLFIEHILF